MNMVSTKQPSPVSLFQMREEQKCNEIIQTDEEFCATDLPQKISS